MRPNGIAACCRPAANVVACGGVVGVDRAGPCRGTVSRGGGAREGPPPPPPKQIVGLREHEVVFVQFSIGGPKSCPKFDNSGSNRGSLAAVCDVPLHSIAFCAQQWSVHWHLYVSLLTERYLWSCRPLTSHISLCAFVLPAHRAHVHYLRIPSGVKRTTAACCSCALDPPPPPAAGGPGMQHPQRRALRDGEADSPSPPPPRPPAGVVKPGAHVAGRCGHPGVTNPPCTAPPPPAPPPPAGPGGRGRHLPQKSTAPTHRTALFRGSQQSGSGMVRVGSSRTVPVWGPPSGDRRTFQGGCPMGMGWVGVYPPPLLYKLRPCPSYSGRRDRNNLGPNYNSVPNVVQPHKTWVW